MPTKSVEKPRKRATHRDMPADPHHLAKVMFTAADKKIEERRAVEKPAARKR